MGGYAEHVLRSGRHARMFYFVFIQIPGTYERESSAMKPSFVTHLIESRSRWRSALLSGIASCWTYK